MTVLPPLAFAIPGDIATLTGGFIYERRLLEGLRAQGHAVQHIRLPASFPEAGSGDMAEAAAALAAVDADRPLILDGLVFGAIDTAVLAGVAAPVVAMIHHPLAQESDLSAARRDQLFRTERDNLRLARHVIVPSPHTRAMLVDRYGADPARITIARPGTDRPRLPPAPGQPPLILSVGILHPRKGHDVLIEALARIADLPWRAVIAGNPWDRTHAAALAQRLAALPHRERIVLAGRVRAAELEGLYARATVFALATRYEGYGIALDEALVRGLPIVSCRVGAVPQTVPTAAGILVPPDDPAAVAAALREVLGNAGRREAMAAAARAAGARLPEWQDTARQVSAAMVRLMAHS